MEGNGLVQELPAFLQLEVEVLPGLAQGLGHGLVDVLVELLGGHQEVGLGQETVDVLLLGLRQEKDGDEEPY